jgi:hypothetical protein
MRYQQTMPGPTGCDQQMSAHDDQDQQHQQDEISDASRSVLNGSSVNRTLPAIVSKCVNGELTVPVWTDQKPASVRYRTKALSGNVICFLSHRLPVPQHPELMA